MNVRALKATMILRNVSHQQLIEALQISKSSYYRKMHGISEYTCTEINNIRKRLKLSDQELVAIFFSDSI